MKYYTSDTVIMKCGPWFKPYPNILFELGSIHLSDALHLRSCWSPSENFYHIASNWWERDCADTLKKIWNDPPKMFFCGMLNTTFNKEPYNICLSDVIVCDGNHRLTLFAIQNPTMNIYLSFFIGVRFNEGFSAAIRQYE